MHCISYLGKQVNPNVFFRQGWHSNNWDSLPMMMTLGNWSDCSRRPSWVGVHQSHLWMFSASPALATLATVSSNIFCLIGAFTALTTNAKYLKYVLNSFKVMASIGCFFNSLMIVLNFGSTFAVPKIKKLTWILAFYNPKFLVRPLYSI